MFHISSDEIFEDGQIIFKEGSFGDWIYLIESGAVELCKKAGEETAVIDVLQKGDFFGEPSFFAKIPRTVSARAVGATIVGIVDRDILDQEFNRLSGNFRKLLMHLVLRLLKQRGDRGRHTWAMYFQPQFMKLALLETRQENMPF